MDVGAAQVQPLQARQLADPLELFVVHLFIAKEARIRPVEAELLAGDGYGRFRFCLRGLSGLRLRRPGFCGGFEAPEVRSVFCGELDCFRRSVMNQIVVIFGPGLQPSYLGAPQAALIGFGCCEHAPAYGLGSGVRAEDRDLNSTVFRLPVQPEGNCSRRGSGHSSRGDYLQVPSRLRSNLSLSQPP